MFVEPFYQRRMAFFRKFINDFEHQAIEAGRSKGYDVVVCGHVHSPQQRTEGSVLYLNSGDWVENLTALEYAHGEWQVYHYNELDYELRNPRLDVALSDADLAEDLRIQNTQAAFVAQFFNEENVLSSFDVAALQSLSRLPQFASIE
jgi:hypothetical protein